MSGLLHLLLCNSFVCWCLTPAPPSYSSSDKKVKLWDVRSKACVETYDNHSNQVTQCYDLSTIAC